MYFRNEVHFALRQLTVPTFPVCAESSCSDSKSEHSLDDCIPLRKNFEIGAIVKCLNSSSK